MKKNQVNVESWSLKDWRWSNHYARFISWWRFYDKNCHLFPKKAIHMKIDNVFHIFFSVHVLWRLFFWKWHIFMGKWTALDELIIRKRKITYFQQNRIPMKEGTIAHVMVETETRTGFWWEWKFSDDIDWVTESLSIWTELKERFGRN